MLVASMAIDETNYKGVVLTKAPGKRFNIKGFLLRVFILVAIGFIILLTWLYVQQDNMIFYPRPVNREILAEAKIAYPTTEDIVIKTTDGVTLKGWMVKNSRSPEAPLVILFGGNADEVSRWIWTSERFSGYSLAMVNYRGYGDSQGRPSQDALFQDALLIYDTLVSRSDIDPDNIVLMGSSLGTGVAVHVASNRPISGVILSTPYDSLANVAQANYPSLPVKWLLKHPFDSLSKAPDIKVPLLALVAEKDTTIPPIHAKRLAEQWGGAVTYEVIPNKNHNTLSQDPLYWVHIDGFLDSLVR